jgi:hypothetical protein
MVLDVSRSEISVESPKRHFEYTAKRPNNKNSDNGMLTREIQNVFHDIPHSLLACPKNVKPLIAKAAELM